MDLKMVKTIGLQKTAGEINGEKMAISDSQEEVICAELLIVLLIQKLTLLNEKLFFFLKII
jgi:hypothetical protein